MKADPKKAAGRAFVRSLNILLKFARLYGYEHVRTIEQLQTAWQELRTAIPMGTDSGLLLGATNSQLLLDGVPLEGSPAEKQFAQLLSAAGLASVQFFASVTEEEIGRFVRAFPTGKAKPAELALQLKAALAGAQGIHINEIYFVATDARLKDASMAAQIAAASLGGDQEEFRQWLNDPQKLLELIAAAQGSKSGGVSGPGPGGPMPAGGATGAGDSGAAGLAGGGSGYGGGAADGGTSTGTGPGAGSWTAGGSGGGPVSGTASGAGVGSFGAIDSGLAAGLGAGLGAGKGSGRGGHGEPSEEEIFGILSALTSFGHVGTGQGGVAAAGVFQEQMSQLPGRAQDMLKQALASLAAQAPNAKPDESVIVQLAEHLAIRFALERFERGEVKVNAVRQMLDRMNQEIENLRKILGAHEDKMSEAGMLVQSHREILDRQFWAAVPESGKRAVLLSGEAWCIPPRNVQSYVGGLIEQGNIAEAISILQNYAACADSEEAEARKKTAVGLSEMAELYAKADPRLLSQALRHLGLQLSVEQDSELQGLVSAAFVRLSQEAATSRFFPAMEQALDLVAGFESQRPGIARSLRSKMGIEERVPEFVEEALKARQVAAGLTNVLKLLPQTTMEQLSARFNRCSLREDSEHVANLAGDLGEEAVQYLRSTVRGGPVAEAVEMAGLLSRLDPESVMVYLPGRMKDFSRTSQDRIVRQISASGAARRCHILLELIDHVDPLVTPLVIDEIGVTSDREALGKLLTLADGDLPPGGGPYLRVKAIEALGRIQAPESASTLKRLLEAKKVFGWVQPQELRIAALQALEKLDPDWVRDYLPNSGIDQEDLTLAPLQIPVTSKFVRQRRHTRVRLRKTVRAVCTNLKESCSMEIKTASLTGGVATLSRHLTPGTQVQLRLQIGMRNLQATALMRDSRAQDMAFEIVDMNLDERSKYRRMLAGNLSNSSSNRDAAESDGVPVPAGVAASK
ncbi:MAG TPA: HEAT repeat domain-containing protein [Candidatus Limnocylindria bacterium]|nr:HEAT repeat domain-containing protein [Candidatus Limnocylindria bacterium]